jgi:hypothetical protein
VALADDLISYWSLDEASGNALDAHGSNDLTDNNTVGTGTGKVGNARDFELSASETLSIASNSSLQTGDIDFTLAAWVQFESQAGDGGVVGKYGYDANTREYLVQYRVTQRYLAFLVSANGTAFSEVQASNFGTLSLATWYFVVAWHDATANTINIQVNNSSPNSTSHSTGVLASSSLFRIGGVGNGSIINYFDGLIDEVGFWKRVLTSDERTELYNSGAGRDYAYITAGGGGASTFRRRSSQRNRMGTLLRM